MLISEKGGCSETLLALFTTHPEYLMYLGDGSRLKNEKYCLLKGNWIHGDFHVSDAPLRCLTSVVFLGAELSDLVDPVCHSKNSSGVSPRFF